MQEAMSAQLVNTVITAHAEPGPTTRSAINPQLHTYKAVMNEDIANLTTDFGLKKRLDDPTWEKVTPTTYDTKEHIKRAKKKRPKKKKEVKPFHSFKGDSHNAKASLGREKEQEMDNINMRYKAMVDGMAKEQRATLPKTFEEDSGSEPAGKLATKGTR